MAIEAKDEKTSSESSAEGTATDAVDTKVLAKDEGGSEEVKEGDEDLDYDLFGTQNKDIPYPRFKEVNSKRKEAERGLKDLETNFDQRVADEVFKKENELRRQYEDRLAAYQQQQPANDFAYDDVNNQAAQVGSQELAALKTQIESLQGEIGKVSTASEQERIKREVSNLKHEFPALDEEHVYAIKRARPNMSWEEVAEYSHKKFSHHIESKWKELVASKKAVVNKKVVGPEGLRNMKPEDKPKTWAEARAKAAQYLE